MIREKLKAGRKTAVTNNLPINNLSSDLNCAGNDPYVYVELDFVRLSILIQGKSKKRPRRAVCR